MSDGATRIETINELKIWLEGEFKLIAQGQQTSREDIRQVRSRLHDVSNAVAGLTALDIPGKLESMKVESTKQDGIIEKLTAEQTTLKTTIRVAYGAIAIAGVVVGAILTLALRVAEMFKLGG